jgi:chromosome segregation ATPase
MKQRTWQILILIAALGTIAAWRAAPSAQTRDPDVLGALLVEVRGLRSAMEEMASAGPRIQLAMGRLQLQEQRVNTLIRRLDDTRQTLASLQEEIAQKQERLPRLEEALKRPDLPDRDDITAHAAGLKVQIGAGMLNLQRLQAEEASLAQDAALEQQRWTEINQRLEELDRALTRK